MSETLIAPFLWAALSLDPRISLLIVLAALILPFVFGSLIASSLRMPDYGWKIGLILCTTIISLLAIGKTYNPDTGKFDLPKGSTSRVA